MASDEPSIAFAFFAPHGVVPEMRERSREWVPGLARGNAAAGHLSHLSEVWGLRVGVHGRAGRSSLEWNRGVHRMRSLSAGARG